MEQFRNFLNWFYIKYIKGKAAFIGACISQLTIFYIFYLDVVSYLWLNFIGAYLLLDYHFITKVIYKSE